MAQKNQKKTNKTYTVIFLGDKKPPEKIVMLKRAEWKKFAPLMYTGIGGKVEEGEAVLNGALRELEEETGISGLNITEFARVKFSKSFLYYFLGIFLKKELPLCNEGDLEWKKVSQILSLDIIPSTKIVLEEWSNRGFSLDKPWTMWMSAKADEQSSRLRTKSSGVTLNPRIDNLKEGLH